MFLIFDTETTDIYQKKLDYFTVGQARVCQIAAILLDETFNEIACFSTLIKPNNWVIQQGAYEAHRILMKECEQYGMDMLQALSILLEMYKKANHRVAHNLQFDKKMFEIEMFNHGVIFPTKVITDHCTMITMTPICKLPTKFGRYKWPKLVEAYHHIFGKDFDGQHNALADVRATSKIFKWLVEEGHILINDNPNKEYKDLVLDVMGNVVK